MQNQEQLKLGDKALVAKNHPWGGCVVTLLSFGPYGLGFLGFVGWLVKDTADGRNEFYCHSNDLKPIK